jgi:hypothetical protein
MWKEEKLAGTTTKNVIKKSSQGNFKSSTDTKTSSTKTKKRMARWLDV